MANHPDFNGLGARLAEQTGAHTDDHPLDELLDDKTPGRVVFIPVDQLAPNPDQPRRHFDDESHAGLTASIREFGILQPLTAMPNPDAPGYILIAGERRLRAARAAELKTVPALVRDGKDRLEIALIENVQRENLSPLEEAEALLKLKKERGYTDELLAQVIGKRRSTVTEILSLNDLPDNIKAHCRAPDKWSKTQLLHLVRAGSDSERDALWSEMLAGRLTTDRALRRATHKKGHRASAYRFSYVPTHGRFRVLISFRKAKVPPHDIQTALQEALASLDSDA